MMYRVTVHAGPSLNPGDVRPSSAKVHNVAIFGEALANQLHDIGLDYKTADYFSTRQVVIVIDPDDTETEDEDKQPSVIEEFLREAKPALNDALTELREVIALVKGRQGKGD